MVPVTVRTILVCSVVFAACGGSSSASLSDLRCDDPCQDFADPFLLYLLVDYDDPMGVLEHGDLHVKLDGKDHLTVSVSEAAPGRPLPPEGTLRFPVPLNFSRLEDGRTFTIAVQAETVHGERTNERVAPFRMTL